MQKQDREKIKKYFKEYIFGFIFNDIQSGIKGKANFLTALGLLCYTEFMGGLMNGGFAQGRATSNFNTFFDFLGSKYKNFRSSHNVYKIYRCGMAHEYFIKGNFTIYMRGGSPGVAIGPDGRYLFFVENYFKDFKKACHKFYRQILKEINPAILNIIQSNQLSGSRTSSNAQVLTGGN